MQNFYEIAPYSYTPDHLLVLPDSSRLGHRAGVAYGSDLTHYFRVMNEARLKGKLELIWWGFTLIVAGAALVPIWLQTHDFPFYIENLVFIVIAITFTRYAFLLRHTFIANMLWPKLFILAISTILIFVMIMALGDFTNFLDEKGLQLLVDHHPVVKQYRVMKYIQGEMIFFGVASVFSAIILALRMLVSIWRMHNRGTV